MKKMWYVALGVISCVMAGCVSPEISSSTRVDLDDERVDGALSSADIRTVASQMCPAILSLPEVVDAPSAPRIKIAGMKNSSRFFIDNDLFMKRLSVELNRYGRGQVRFLSANERVSAGRAEVLRERQSAYFQEQIKAFANQLKQRAFVASAEKPIKVAVLPPLNTNLVNMNAESFTAMVRSAVAEAADGKILFLMPGETEGADYWMATQFYPESMQLEGVINLANYIEVIDSRIREGKSMYIEDNALVNVTPLTTTVVANAKREDVLLQMLRNPELRKASDSTKRLNVMLVNPKDKVCVYESTVTVTQRTSPGNSGAADYLLSGEISGLSTQRGGSAADYLLITVTLVEPVSNEVIWEDAYEVKRVTQTGTVYR
ncbi:MAG: hypothetical protein IKW38_07860 [Kiritimatiellae bacterium]|nr:hypothetical protein [Kiritimatiellia bacterium]